MVFRSYRELRLAENAVDTDDSLPPVSVGVNLCRDAALKQRVISSLYLLMI